MLLRRLNGMKKRAAGMGMGDVVGFVEEKPKPAAPSTPPKPSDIRSWADAVKPGPGSKKVNQWIEEFGASAFLAHAKSTGASAAEILPYFEKYRNRKGVGVTRRWINENVWGRSYPKTSATPKASATHPGVAAEEKKLAKERGY
jgi:hypothetical protein